MNFQQFGIPEIFEEGITNPFLKHTYQDIKYILRVPIVNFVFRTLGHYEQFLHIGWNQVRPNMLTRNIEEAASSLRYPSISFEGEIPWENFYSKEGRKQIESVIFTFNYVNPKLLLITTAWEESLGYRPIIGRESVKGLIKPGNVTNLPSIPLLHFYNAPLSVQEVFLDMMKKKNGYDVASDYRALALYPSFFKKSWSKMKEYIGTEDYLLQGYRIKEKARELVHQFPYPVSFTPEALSRYYSNKDIAGICGIVSMFSSFITYLIVEGECLRRLIERKESN